MGWHPYGAQVWLQEIEKIFRVTAYVDAHKVLLGTHMLAKEAEYLGDNTRQRLEATGTEITWENFNIAFLEKYFPTDVRSEKEIEFLELKQGNMIIVDYVAKLRSCIGFYLIAMG